MFLQPVAGFESVQGRRWSMEDTHVLIDDLNEAFNLPKDKRRSFYAVYDGHGGKDAANIAADFLHKVIIEDPAFLNGDIALAIKNGFARTDEHILGTSERDNWTNGTTAVMCFIIDNKLYLANIGDSEAVIALKHDGKHEAHLLSYKHKPAVTEERERIEKAGGRVICGRVLGNLAVARAFGDLDFKHPYNRAEGHFVSAEPYIVEYELSADNPFLVVACDGLWDKLSYQDAVDFVAAARAQGKNSSEISELIAKESLDMGSADNVTVIVVFLDWKGISN